MWVLRSQVWLGVEVRLMLASGHCTENSLSGIDNFLIFPLPEEEGKSWKLELWPSFCPFEFLSGEWGLGSSILSVPAIVELFVNDGSEILVLKELFNVSLQWRRHGEEEGPWTFNHSGWDLILTPPPCNWPNDSIVLILHILINKMYKTMHVNSQLTMWWFYCHSCCIFFFLIVINTILPSPALSLTGCLWANYSNCNL